MADANEKQKVKTEDLGNIREDILRPLPKTGLRGIITLVIAAIILSWSMIGTEASPQRFAEGIPTLVDFTLGLLPPEFEFAEGSERAIMFPSFETREISTTPKTDRARKASDDDIANLTDDQTLVYVLRLTGAEDDLPIIITPEEAAPYLPRDIEPASLEAVEPILAALEDARVAAAETDSGRLEYDGARVFYAVQETADDDIDIINSDDAQDIDVNEVVLFEPYIVENGDELVVEEIDDTEVVMVQTFVHTLNPYISEAGQDIVLDGWDQSVLVVDDGQKAVFTVPYDEGQIVVAKRYVLEPGEMLIGYPVLIDSIVETAQIAIIGTLFSILLAIPFGLLAADNTTPHPIVYQVTRLFLNTLRSLPVLIYALIFVSAVGLGPFAGVLAIVVGSVGGLGRLFAESFEQVDPQQVAAVRATGAGGVQVFNFAVLPQAFPLLTTYTLITFEANVRDFAILGIVGAGGVGFIIQKYAALFQLQRLMGAVIILAIMTTILDRFSAYVRKRII